VQTVTHRIMPVARSSEVTRNAERHGAAATIPETGRKRTGLHNTTSCTVSRPQCREICGRERSAAVHVARRQVDMACPSVGTVSRPPPAPDKAKQKVLRDVTRRKGAGADRCCEQRGTRRRSSGMKAARGVAWCKPTQLSVLLLSPVMRPAGSSVFRPPPAAPRAPASRGSERQSSRQAVERQPPSVDERRPSSVLRRAPAHSACQPRRQPGWKASSAQKERRRQLQRAAVRPNVWRIRPLPAARPPSAPGARPPARLAR